MAPFPPDLEQRLTGYRPPPESGEPPPRRAAVAIVLRRLRSDPQVLLMRRAEHSEDPWSGHISFPGGGQEDRDENLFATAVRETREEVGLDLLDSATSLCRLGAVTAMARGQRLDMDITPFVFSLAADDIELVTNHEAEEAFWLPLSPLATGEWQTEHDYVHEGVARKLPAWRYEGHVIWGLTHHMICQFLDVARGG